MVNIKILTFIQLKFHCIDPSLHGCNLQKRFKKGGVVVFGELKNTSARKQFLLTVTWTSGTIPDGTL